MTRIAIRIFYTITFDLGVIYGHAASSWQAALGAVIGFTLTTLFLTLWERA